MKVYLEYHDEKSHKYWELELKGKVFKTFYGNIGNPIKNGTEDYYDSKDEARTKADELIRAKLAEGYKKMMEEGKEADKVEESKITKAEAIAAEIKKAVEEESMPYVSLGIGNSKDIEAWESNIGIKAYFLSGSEIPIDNKGNNLLFFGQINFDILPKLPGYPEKGLLQFFLPEKFSGFEKNAVVIYHESIITDKTKLKNPKGLRHITKGTYNIHTATETTLSHPYPPDKRFYQIMETFIKQHQANKEIRDFIDEEINNWKQRNDGHRIGGYAFFTQEDPRSRADYRDYLNLFQIDELDDEIMLWGDSGIAHFLIHSEDLAKRDFSKVLFVWDCF